MARQTSGTLSDTKPVPTEWLVSNAGPSDPEAHWNVDLPESVLLQVRRLGWISIIASAATLGADALIGLGDASGPLVWILTASIPQTFVVPTTLVALWSLRKRAWASAALSGTVALGQLFGPLGLCLGRPGSGASDLRVLSYNVGQFEAGRWPEPTVTAVAETIRRLHPDVACLQEAHYHGRLRFGDRLVSELPAYHSYREAGMIVLSKRPILRAETQFFASHEGGHWNVQEIRMEVADRTVRILNVHMIPDGYEPPWWPKLSWPERIARKQRLRDEETAEIVRRVEAETGPVVVCGDFNTQPFDPRYRHLGKILTDAYRATSTGFGFTSTPRWPTRRIDYVWVRGLRPLRTEVPSFATSDHLPLIAELRFATASR